MVISKTIVVPMVLAPLGKAALKLVQVAILGGLGSHPPKAKSKINQPTKHAHQSSFCNTEGLSFPLLIISPSFQLNKMLLWEKYCDFTLIAVIQVEIFYQLTSFRPQYFSPENLFCVIIS